MLCWELHIISCIDAVNTTVGGAVGNRTGDDQPRG